MSFYEIILFLHEIIRWMVLVFGIFAVVLAFIGWLARKNWSKVDNLAGLNFTSLVDIQVLLGLILFFISPITSAGLRNFSDAMKVADVRFFMVEHSLAMLIALVVAHIGRAQVKRAVTDLSKHRRAALWFLVSLVLILAAIPWNRLIN